MLEVRNARARRAEKIAPLPPNSLIFSATGTRDVGWFLESGVKSAQSFRDALSAVGRPLESFSSVLDFGCGCGRVMRQWAGTAGPEFTGCDYNERAIRWDRKNLTFARFELNRLRPPLPFGSESFDLCYSVSVFTHLPAELQRPWISELYRVLRPNAILMLTLSGEGDFRRLTETDRAQFDRGERIVLDPKFAGTNMCGVFHPVGYVKREWSDLFELLNHFPRGARGSPNQDLFVFRRK